MLTPEQIQAAREQYGITPSTSSMSSAPASPEDRIKAVTTRAQELYQSQSPYQTGNPLTSPVATYKQGEKPSDLAYAAGAVANLPSSAARLGKEVVTGMLNIFNPDFLYQQITKGNTDDSQNTLVNLAKLGSGLLEKATGAITGKKIENSDTARVDAVKNMLLERYGSVENVNRTLKEDPAGVLFDVATLLEGGGAALKATKIGKTAGTALKAAGEAINPVRTGVEVASSAAKPLGAGAEKLYSVAAPMEQSTARTMQAYQASKPSLLERVQGVTASEKPITEANTAMRAGLAGTEWKLGVQAKKAATGVWDNVIEPGLKGQSFAENPVNMKDFFNDLRKKVIAETPELTRRNSLLEGVDSLIEDYGKVNDVSFKKLQDYKSGWAKLVPERAYKGKPIAGALNEVRNMAAQQAREMIYGALGSEAKQAYIDYGNLQSIQEAGIKTSDALRSKGFTKQIWEAIVDKAVTPSFSWGGYTVYKTAEGLEFIGSSGAKTVRDIVSGTGAAQRNFTPLEENQTQQTR